MSLMKTLNNVEDSAYPCGMPFPISVCIDMSVYFDCY